MMEPGLHDHKYKNLIFKILAAGRGHRGEGGVATVQRIFRTVKMSCMVVF